jgi:hypothetical protein
MTESYQGSQHRTNRFKPGRLSVGAHLPLAVLAAAGSSRSLAKANHAKEKR